MNPQNARSLGWLTNGKAPSCLISHRNEFAAQGARVLHRTIVEYLLDLRPIRHATSNENCLPT
jgi:hypothetical protein